MTTANYNVRNREKTRHNKEQFLFTQHTDYKSHVLFYYIFPRKRPFLITPLPLTPFDLHFAFYRGRFTFSHEKMGFPNADTFPFGRNSSLIPFFFHFCTTVLALNLLASSCLHHCLVVFTVDTFHHDQLHPRTELHFCLF